MGTWEGDRSDLWCEGGRERFIVSFHQWEIITSNNFPLISGHPSWPSAFLPSWLIALLDQHQLSVYRLYGRWSSTSAFSHTTQTTLIKPRMLPSGRHGRSGRGSCRTVWEEKGRRHDIKSNESLEAIVDSVQMEWIGQPELSYIECWKWWEYVCVRILFLFFYKEDRRGGGFNSKTGNIIKSLKCLFNSFATLNSGTLK